MPDTQTFSRRLGIRLSHRPYVADALSNTPDLSVFKERPTPKMVLGLFLVLISYVLGWPLIGAFSYVAIRMDRAVWIPLGGPLIYGFSHLVWTAGMILLGLEGRKHAGVFLKWATAKGVRLLLGEDDNPDQPST